QIASFLNTEKGGTLLIGVTDDKEIIGLDLDYQNVEQANKRDAYQLFLINDLLLPKLGKDLATLIDITFHEVERKDVCRIIVKTSPRPVFVEVKTKGDKKQRCLFVRSGNLTSKLTTDQEIENYCKSRWG
ncbi:MAG: ATP-binding protein, partial [Calothrix sp. SM1_7_51]|nr:ATP-binding protein [Calothrix sp. SM1_7_51]